jgi:hypothetical protein
MERLEIRMRSYAEPSQLIQRNAVFVRSGIYLLSLRRVCLLCLELPRIYCVSSGDFYGSLLHSMALPAHSGLRLLIQFHNHFSQKVGLLG